MVRHLPKWSWFGGGILAFSAGMINVIALLGFSHEAATHVTGLFSQLAIHLYEIDLSACGPYFYAIFSFFLGSFFCGLIIRDPNFKGGRRYGYALAVESLILFLSAYGFIHQQIWGAYLASVAAGLQNAMVSHFSGAIVRTTHLTGILTDLGVLTGNIVMRRERVDIQRLALFFMIMVSFFSGCLVGALGYHHWQAHFMFAPAILIGVLSVGYTQLKTDK